jgi:ubiquinone/menaquinone biosynthesis C-methylase UbiE
VLARPITVADVGCGAGYMGVAFERLVQRLILIDPSPAMLREAERRLGELSQPPELEYRQGSFEALPLADGEVDGLVAGMVLHHLPSPDDAMAELRRVLAPGGSAAVLELFPHRESWMHAELGDRHLGLEPAEVLRALGRAGFEDLAVETVADRYRPRRADGETASLPLYLVRGRAPLVSNPKTPSIR